MCSPPPVGGILITLWQIQCPRIMGQFSRSPWTATLSPDIVAGQDEWVKSRLESILSDGNVNESHTSIGVLTPGTFVWKMTFRVSDFLRYIHTPLRSSSVTHSF